MGILRAPTFYPTNKAEFDRWVRSVTVDITEYGVADGQFLGTRAGVTAGYAIQDSDLPATIARDTEVTAAIAAHEAAADPHPQYRLESNAVTYAEITGKPASLALIFSGTGTPEGAVTAGIGSIFLRTDGGVGTSLYSKTSGAGNTGWTAIT